MGPDAYPNGSGHLYKWTQHLSEWIGTPIRMDPETYSSGSVHLSEWIQTYILMNQGHLSEWIRIPIRIGSRTCDRFEGIGRIMLGAYLDPDIGLLF